MDVANIPRKTVDGGLVVTASVAGLERSELHVVYAERGAWRDGCIGSYVPGSMCTRAITPGWRAIIRD